MEICRRAAASTQYDYSDMESKFNSYSVLAGEHAAIEWLPHKLK
jgi:hypothetical protein